MTERYGVVRLIASSIVRRLRLLSFRYRPEAHYMRGGSTRGARSAAGLRSLG